MPAKKKVAKKAAKKTAKVDKKETPRKAVTIARKSPPKKAAPAVMSAKEWVKKQQSRKELKGKAQIKTAAESYSAYLLRRSTGILSVDIALGGGVQAGGAAEVHGEESVGKTHLVFRIAGEVQRAYGDDAAILIYYTEIRTDKGFARKSGFHVAYSEEEVQEYEELRVARGLPAFTDEERADLLSETGTVVFLSASTADEGLNVVIDGLRDGVFQLVIMESMGAFLTGMQDEKQVGERTVAGSAGIITTFQNKVYPLFMMDRPDGSMLETTIIGISQARANIDGGMWDAKTKSSTGAFAWKHGQLVSIHLGRGGKLKDTGGNVIGRKVRWTFTKGKAGTHDGKSGEYSFYHMDHDDPVFWKDCQESFLGGVDNLEDAVSTAVSCGIVRVDGSWYSWPEQDVRGQGSRGFVNAMVQKDPELPGVLWQACLDHHNLFVRYT